MKELIEKCEKAIYEKLDQAEDIADVLGLMRGRLADVLEVCTPLISGEIKKGLEEKWTRVICYCEGDYKDTEMNGFSDDVWQSFWKEFE